MDDMCWYVLHQGTTQYFLLEVNDLIFLAPTVRYKSPLFHWFGPCTLHLSHTLTGKAQSVSCYYGPFIWWIAGCNIVCKMNLNNILLPFNSADTIPCKLGSSPNQNTHNSFALLILSGSLLDWQPVKRLLRHAHKMSWLRADENDFNTGSSTGPAPHVRLKTYFRHFKPHKSVCPKREKF